MPREVLRRSELAAPAEAVARWLRRRGALERLLPPWEPLRLLADPGGGGGRSVVRAPRGGPVGLEWVLDRHEEGERAFRDVQVRGPFARYEHVHRVREAGPERAGLEDKIEYALPGGRPGRVLAGPAIHRRLERALAYRHRTVAGDLAAHRRADPGRRLQVAVSGSHGLVGSALVSYLRAAGHRAVRVVRREPRGPEEVEWRPDGGLARPKSLAGTDAVVHLAGEPLTGLWTRRKKEAIARSRVGGTRRLARDLAALDDPPSTMVCASAIGYYGDRGDDLLPEGEGPGAGFLARVCRDWEEAAAPAAAAGVRIVHLRLGLVLSPAGGALGAMLPAFRLGAGAVLGSGRQFMGWISLDDVLDVILAALVSSDLEGPVNAVAPNPVRNRQFSEVLARVLGRPLLLRVPGSALRTLLGGMADDMLLSSARTVPQRLQEAGHRFRHPSLEPALRHALGRQI